MIKERYLTKTLGEIVADDFSSAGIFKGFGIDFCCGGKKTFEQACTEQDLDPEAIAGKLYSLESSPQRTGLNFNEWPLDFLMDYISNNHHTYVRKTLPELVLYTQKIASVHGLHHPELSEVADLFKKIDAELVPHLKQEDEVLFPAIKEGIKAVTPQNRELIRSEINRMHGEHEFAGSAMDNINRITNNYQVPADGCNTYQVAFKLLQQFEDDLHIHVHLENNILFPKALQL